MQVRGNTLQMQLNDYRGLSAYEVAVKNGFGGTEAEWLESLKGKNGADGSLVTVNNKQSVDGNITVNAADIYIQPGVQGTTVADKIAAVEDLVEVNAQSISTATTATASKAEAYAQLVSLPVASWTQDGEIYKQTAEVAHITIDAGKTSAIVSPSTDRGKEEAYLAAQVRASEQGSGTLTFTCVELPEIDIEANVMVIVKGVPAS